MQIQPGVCFGSPH